MDLLLLVMIIQVKVLCIKEYVIWKYWPNGVWCFRRVYYFCQGGYVLPGVCLSFWLFVC